MRRKQVNKHHNSKNDGLIYIMQRTESQRKLTNQRETKNERRRTTQNKGKKQGKTQETRKKERYRRKRKQQNETRKKQRRIQKIKGVTKQNKEDRNGLSRILSNTKERTSNQVYRDTRSEQQPKHTTNEKRTYNEQKTE